MLVLALQFSRSRTTGRSNGPATYATCTPMAGCGLRNESLKTEEKTKSMPCNDREANLNLPKTEHRPTSAPTREWSESSTRMAENLQTCTP